jgi:hypothetical protein
MNAIVAKVKSQRSEPQNSPSECRAAYPYFHEKRTKNAAGVPFVKKDGTPNPRYNATFMFPKLSADASQCANYMFLWGLAQEAAKKMWPQNVDGQGNWVWPTGAQYAVKDGDVPFTSKPKPGQPVPSAEEIAKKNEWRRGYWIVEAENFLNPGPRIAKAVAGSALPQDLLAKTVNGVEQYKSGDWGIVNIHAYAYQNETFGVNFGFDGFCFTREGEQIGSNGGQKSAQQMFGGVQGSLPASGGAPMPPGVPAAPIAPTMAPPPIYAAPPAAPVAPPASPAPIAPQAPQYAPPAPQAPAPTYAAPPAAPGPQYSAPPMPPGAPAGLPPFPGR